MQVSMTRTNQTSAGSIRDPRRSGRGRDGTGGRRTCCRWKQPGEPSCPGPAGPSRDWPDHSGAAGHPPPPVPRWRKGPGRRGASRCA